MVYVEFKRLWGVKAMGFRCFEVYVVRLKGHGLRGFEFILLKAAGFRRLGVQGLHGLKVHAMRSSTVCGLKITVEAKKLETQ